MNELTRNQRVFFYGSNKLGHEDFNETKVIRLLGEGRTLYKHMLIPSRIPFIAKNFPFQHIAGEVWEVDQLQLNYWDYFFSINEQIFLREELPIMYHSFAKNVEVKGYCWVYIGNIMTAFSGLKMEDEDCVSFHQFMQ